MFDFGNENLEGKLQAFRAKAIRLSGLRLAAFFAMGALLILGFAEQLFWLIPGLGTIWVFISLIQKFNYAKDQEAIYLALQKIEDQKIARQQRQLSGLNAGSEFAYKAHPFSNDLDLFGTHSLFQLMNHSTSPGGKQKLAGLMNSDFSIAQAKKRAIAVSELSGKPEFLRSMEAVGLAFQGDKPVFDSWKNWLTEPEKSTGFHILLAFLGPFGGMALLILVTVGIVPQAFLGLWILVGVLVLSLIFKPLKQAAESIPLSSQMKSMRIRAERIESENMDAELVSEEKSKLYSDNRPASAQLKALDQLGLWVQNRLNLLYLPVNLLFWTDFLLFLRLQSWKKQVGTSLHQLPESLENWEVWVSLGSFELEVGYPGKALWSEEKLLQAKNVTHPLIHPEKAVGNSIKLGNGTALALLTGSNMSGKTTFMRTLGTNAVLVNLGLRPFADEFVLGPVQLYTSMRNSDNLGESVSSFYAELFRIRRLIQRLESGEAVLFMLDEILKGTNTQDRVSGSEALIQQLLKTPGFGIISTHDIELAKIAEHTDQVQNFSFHSEIQDQDIRFDYMLKDGPCPSFNAHKLMELMGIKFGEIG